MVLEWLALLGLVALVARLSRVRRVRFLVAVTGLLLVAGSYVWRFHVERGQYYVFVALLVTAGVGLLRKRRGDHAGAGFLFGLAMALRPPVAVLLLPLAWAGLRRTSLSAALTAGLALTSTLFWASPETWRNYTWMAGEWEKAMLDESYLGETYGRLPRQKEGVDGYQMAMLPLRGPSVTVGSMLAGAGRRLPGWLPPAVHAPSFQRFCFLGVLAVWFGLLAIAHRLRRLSVREAVTAGVWLMVLTDYFLPMRVEYADILFLLPVALAMPLLARRGGLLVLILAWLPVVLLPAPYFTDYWRNQVIFRAVLLLGLCSWPLVVTWRRRFAAVRRRTGDVQVQTA
jgi:hypothetical protein